MRPGHDWILIRLGARGTINTIEVDTNHFKGNYPDRCSLQGIDAPGARITDLIASAAWMPLLPEVKLAADERRFFTTEIVAHVAVSHVRLNIFPDGGVSRLRLWGTRAAEPHAVLNALSIDEARAALLRCCGATRWAAWLLTQRPFASTEALFKAAAGVWTQMEKADMLEAFSHHPEIGSDIASLRQRFASTAAWSSAEQAGVAGADDATLEALRDGNVRYREKFGYVFLVCATGKTAAEMLALLRARLAHDPDAELQVAAAEQAKITRLRLEKLVLMSPITSHVLDTALGRPARGTAGPARRARRGRARPHRRRARHQRSGPHHRFRPARHARRADVSPDVRHRRLLRRVRPPAVLPARRRRLHRGRCRRAPPHPAAPQPLRLLHLPRHVT